jgi:hypothetical protein
VTETLYKATRTDGTDFRTGTVDYGAHCGKRALVGHPFPDQKMVSNDASTYLSVSVSAADTLIGGSWPCRLFRVEARGSVLSGLSASPNKRAVQSLKVVEELPAWQSLGPNGDHVVAFIEKCRVLSADELKRLAAAWEAAARAAARDAAWAAAGATARAAAGDAARAAAWDAVGEAAGGAARGAALALVVRDVLPQRDYDILTMPCRRAIGRIHPDDADVELAA